MYETLKCAIPAITARQREVVELIAEGCSNEEIGERLGTSPRTAKAHSDILRQKQVVVENSVRQGIEHPKVTRRLLHASKVFALPRSPP